MITLFMGIQWSAFPSRRTIHWESIRTKVPSATLGAVKPVLVFDECGRRRERRLIWAV